VTAVCVVHELIPGPKDVGRTAIDKRPVAGHVEIGALGLAGDQVCDTENHGGAEQALYAYADEEADWWAEQLQREIPPGLFGENLRTAGLAVSTAEIGERWRVGGAGGVLLQVTGPRIPCITFAERMDEPHWVKRFGQGRRPGAYLAVVEPGAVRAGDGVEVTYRPGHGVAVADTFPSPEPDVARRLLDAHADPGSAFELTPKLYRWSQQQVSTRGA
jgi:MOSC domain-containing protein YiiM